ncbi:dynamin family protein [Bacillus testis]|uniref:dynamin family protein n=1 Tax=Bacillus testis TaxID=1622072 RepID=UPI00067EF584|nr:dynamin family protein [Bacillus testis]
MTIENHLSKKTYYETLLEDRNSEDIVRILGNMFQEENMKELADLSYIRFAQGEVYFHYHDYEAAVFKWENISNELQPWARKNVGDAYFELGLLPDAIDTYKSTKTDQLILQTEISLKLFEIYIKENNQEKAVDYIKQAVSINPDYQDITDVARAFFEQNGDWKHAVELALNEAVRTGAVDWFDKLHSYVSEGHTEAIAPEYFSYGLEVLYGLDAKRFEDLTAALWRSYHQGPFFLQWMKSLNQLLQTLDLNLSSYWRELSGLYQTAFMELAGGRFELKEIREIMPELLTNWAAITERKQALAAYSALLAWNEFFPESIKPGDIQRAENQIWDCAKNADLLDDSLHLFDSLVAWASKQDVEVSAKLRWFVEEILDLSKQNILVAGVNDIGKSSFINTVLKQDLFDGPTRNTIRLKDGERPQLTFVSERDLHSETIVPDVYAVLNRPESAGAKSLTDLAIPSEVLGKNRIAIIDTPGFRGRKDEQEVIEFLPLADCLLFVLDAEDPFTDQERDILLKMTEQSPYLPVAFVITKLDTIYNKKEAKRIVDETYNRILEYVPNTQVIAFSSKYDIDGQDQAIESLFRAISSTDNQAEKRAGKMLQVIRKTITFLLESRVEKKNKYKQGIAWNQDMVKKLTASINHVQDLEAERSEKICKDYHMIKEDMKASMIKDIPEMLKGCSELLNEDSDFRKVHLQLNNEMNIRIQTYIDEKILPKYYHEMEEWILRSKDELMLTKQELDEMAGSFNSLYGEQKVSFAYDFRILNDWQRDMNRMTSGVRLEEENILLRHTPSQFILKSAGKLFNAIAQKNMLYNQYKKFIENESYTETTNNIVSKFMLPFEVFEKAIERDLHLFFKPPVDILNGRVEEAHAQIREKEELLALMKENPEVYHDAIRLFEVRLRQYEWMMSAVKEISYIAQ